MYKFEDVSKACLMIADELLNDPSAEAKNIITLIDEAEHDADIKKGIQLAVEYLFLNGKQHIAQAIKEKAVGFAF